MKAAYQKKYAALLERIQEAKKNSITLFVIQEPQELGETYEDMVESLNQIADADLNLAILPRDARADNAK